VKGDQREHHLEDVRNDPPAGGQGPEAHAELVMKVAAGGLDQVEEITAVLQNAAAPAGSNARASTRKPRARLDRRSAAEPALLPVRPEEGPDCPNVSVANGIRGA